MLDKDHTKFMKHQPTAGNDAPRNKSGAMDEETYILLGMFRSLYVEVLSRVLADVVPDATHITRIALD